jgi:hypothetical protein
MRLGGCESALFGHAAEARVEVDAQPFEHVNDAAGGPIGGAQVCLAAVGMRASAQRRRSPSWRRQRTVPAGIFRRRAISVGDRSW